MEREGWEVHHQVEDPSLSGPPLEDDPALAQIESEEERQEEILRRLQRVDAAHAEHKRALILFCSHIGGHKYAGNVIVSLLLYSFLSICICIPPPALSRYVCFGRCERD